MCGVGEVDRGESSVILWVSTIVASEIERMELVVLVHACPSRSRAVGEEESRGGGQPELHDTCTRETGREDYRRKVVRQVGQQPWRRCR